MNWYKIAEITEKLDPQLERIIDSYKTFKTPLEEESSQYTWPDEEDMEYLNRSLVEKRNKPLTHEEHECLRNIIGRKNSGEISEEAAKALIAQLFNSDI